MKNETCLGRIGTVQWGRNLEECFRQVKTRPDGQHHRLPIRNRP